MCGSRPEKSEVKRRESQGREFQESRSFGSEPERGGPDRFHVVKQGLPRRHGHQHGLLSGQPFGLISDTVVAREPMGEHRLCTWTVFALGNVWVHPDVTIG